MSKKTRKKSPKESVKAAPAKAPRAASAKSPKALQTKTRAAKAGKTAGNAARKPPKAAKVTKKPIKKATKAESQKAPSKPLKSVGPKAPARSKAAATATTPQASHPQVSAPAPASTAAPAVSPPMPKPVLPTPVPESAPEPAAKPTSKPAAKSAAKPAANSGLSEGAKAPAFDLPRDGGGTVSLSGHAGRKLVLFFYPRADTPGCTKEAIDFTRLAGAFAENQTAVLGVSADPPKAQESFRDKHQLATPLVSDEQHEMLEAYGVWGEKSMYGRTFLGIVRTTVLIGADGRVLKIWRNVKVDGHADEVLATVRAL
jgi:peroxiredoxin Q/BCP